MSSTAPATENTVPLEAPSINPPVVPPLSLPPEGCFDSYEALFTSAQQHAKSALYAFTIGNSERRNGKIIRIILCQYGGLSIYTASYKAKSNQQNTSYSRNRNTTKTECLFSIKARERTNYTWTLSHCEGEKYQSYNYNSAEGLNAFSTHRQLNQDQLELVKFHRSTCIAPK